MNPHAQLVRNLSKSLDLIEALMDGETHAGRSAALEATHQYLTEAFLEADFKAQTWESERPRREAETRLAHHIENDTLDLY